MTKQEKERRRLHIANEFIRIVSEHGRRFFRHKDCVTRLELDERGRVWLIDKYSQKRICTQYRYWGQRQGFTEGGTLRELICELRDFIKGKESNPLGMVGPWPQWVCGGDLWGYGEEESRRMRERLKQLFEEQP